jgi:phytoene desaturase
LYQNNHAKRTKLKVAIIGSGVGGLSTAIRLKLKGFEVDVFESNSYPGGKLSEFTRGGYRYDAGPSLFTMPENVTELFKLAGKNPTDYFQYVTVDIACRYFFADGTQLTAWADKQKFAEECERVLQVPKKVVLDFLQHSSDQYQITSHIFMEQSLHKLKTYLSASTFLSFLKLYKLELHKTMNQANEDRLKHPKLVQLFNRYATYNGSNPYSAPGILNVIPHLEYNIGSFFPKGGMINITNSLYKLAQDLGVNFKFNTVVDKISTENKRVSGIEIGGELIAYNRVVSNMDIVPTYQKLLAHLPAPKKTMNQERSSSAIIFYWGIKKKFENLGLHNIFFSDNYKEEFRQIFEDGSLYQDPTVYIHISSVMEPADAPENCMNWFVLVNAPYNQGQNWDDLIASTRQRIIKKISALLGEDIAALIEFEDVLEPRTIESKTASYKGSLYGASSNGMLASFIRHPNFSQSIKGLYFCGGSVHPGGGIPLCLLSGKIVADVIE